MTKGKPFPKDVIDQWPEVFGEINVEAVPLAYLHSLRIIFKGGKINPHYDASIDGYINYKCNISVLSENYNFFIDKESINIDETDLYGFEASLYKHWTNEFNSRRVFLSFGFILPYEILKRTENDPRVRLSKRIEKHFQK